MNSTDKRFFPRNNSSLILMIVVLFLISCCSDKSTTPDEKEETVPEIKEQNLLLGSGINFGNALEAPNEGEWGITLKSEYFSIIKAAGFKSVRVPIRWSAHALAEQPYTIDQSFLERIDWVVTQAFQNDLLVILDMHHYEEMMTDPVNHLPRFLALWQQIAERYKDKSWKVMFEILNEPNSSLTVDLWNDFLQQALTIIRETNPNRAVIIGTANWGGYYTLPNLILPALDRNIIVTFHYYNPFEFTHQGAEWVNGSDAWLGTKWLGSDSERQLIDNELNLAQNWAAAQDRPLFVGEFGAYNKAEMSSRVRWTTYMARSFEGRGISWAYWEFATGFGAYDPVANEWRHELLNALIPSNKTFQTGIE